MIKFNKKLTKIMGEFHAYANTVSYLYKNYREERLIESIADKYESSQIIDEIDALLGKRESLSDLLKVYVLIVALSYKPYKEIEIKLKLLEASEIEWVGELANYVLSQSIPETLVTVKDESMMKEYIKNVVQVPTKVDSISSQCKYRKVDCRPRWPSCCCSL